ncbi:MAG: glycosyltransferase family 2 protein [Candidatus Paceibacterota bacterium]|jgi:glycosyltransferase involved in cell wall biosynthesis
MTDRPLISVIMPAYNNEKTIGTAIRSMLGQTYRNLEIIVVNDSSTDGTRAVAEELAKEDARIRVVDSPADPDRFDAKLGRNINAGYSARNTGFAHVRGELVTFQDADDASLANRIETQYELLKKHDAVHVTLDWIKYDEKYLGRGLDVERYKRENPDIMTDPEDLYALSQKTKGVVAKISPALNRIVPFSIKRRRLINKFFFGSLASYPASGNTPLFRREIMEKVKFRKLGDRVWPTFMGRGADRDFDFQVAEAFRRSYVFAIPLYMWRQKNENEKYAEKIEKYIID